METLSLTYAELADRLGIEREAARQLVKRRRWPKWKGNDGQVRISVPEEAFNDRASPGLRPDEQSGSGPGESRVEPGVLPVLTRHIERLEAQLEEALKRVGERDAIATERDVLSAQLMALRDSTTAQVEALRAALAAAERDRDRWHDAAMAPKAEASQVASGEHRSWWRRLVG